MKTLKKALSVILCAVILITAAPLSGFVGMKFPEINFGKFMRALNGISNVITPTASAAAEISFGSDIEIDFSTIWQAPTALCFKGNGEFKISANDEGWYEWYNLLSEAEYIYFTEGITAISADSFSFATKLKTIGTLEIISDGSNTDYEFSDDLPSSITSIGDRAFEGCSSLDNIVFPDKLVSIGNSAFYECTSLTSASLPDTLTNIGKYAFYGCSSLNSVTLPNNLTEIPQFAFSDTKNLSSINLPEKVEIIGVRAFAGSNLKSLEIPASLKDISSTSIYIGNAFSDCPIETINVHPENKFFSAQDNVLFSYDKKTLIMYPPEKPNAEFSIPSSVETIIDSAFISCKKLNTIIIPNTVKNIESDSFYDCNNLYQVIFAPDSRLEYIGSSFYSCDSLTEMHFPATLSNLGNAFEYCNKLTEIEFLSPTPPTVGINIFKNTYITSIKIPQLSEKPEWNQYAETGWNGIPVVDSTDPNACPLVFVDENNKDKYGFSYNSFDSANHTVTCCGYTGNGGDIVIPRIVSKDNEVYYVTKISDSAFRNNSTITSVKLPNTVKDNSHLTFTNCRTLKNISVEAGNSYYSSVGGVLFTQDHTTLLLYPIAKPGESYTVSEHVTKIGQKAFNYNQNLKSVSFESQSALQTIDAFAFYNCVNLETINLPSSLTEIKDQAFLGCQKLKTVIFGTNSRLKTIYPGAWAYCTSLENISLPEGLKTIDNSAFYYCSSIKNVFLIPSTVTDIGENAFFGCGLEEVIILKKVSNIGAGAFSNCAFLTTFNVEYGSPHFQQIDGVLYNSDATTLHTYPSGKKATAFTIPKTVKNINSAAFYGSTKLKEINFTDNAEISSIGEFAFYNCTNLQYVSTEKCSEISSIGHGAFANCDIKNIIFSCKTAPSVTSDSLLFYSSPLEEVYVTDLYLKESWIDYLDSGFGGLPLANKSTTGETMSTVDSNNRDGLGFTYNNFNTSTNTVNIVEFTGSGDVVVPRYVIRNNNLYFVRSFNQDVFAGNKNITSVSFADKVLSIPESAFSGCTSLKSVSFNSQLENISAYAFSGCTSLTSFSTLGEITNIGNGAFSGCTSLKDFSFLPGLTSIGSDAFSGCTSLNSTLILPASLKTIGARAFSGCALKSVQFEGKLTDLGENAFGNIAGLKTAKFRSDPPANVGSSPFGSPDEFYVAYPDSDYEWKNQVSGFTWKGYPAYTYSLISQLPYEDAYPIIVLTVTPDGTPFEGAKVTLGNQTSTTNEDGIALLAYPGEEEQELKIIPGGDTYLESTRKLTISRRSPIIISSLLSASALIEVTVDDENTDTKPAVFNNASKAYSMFNFKPRSDKIEKVELLTADRVLISIGSSDLESDDAKKNGIDKQIALELFEDNKPVIARVTTTDTGEQIPIPLNITVFDGGINFGFSLSPKQEDNPNSKKFVLDQSKIAAPDTKIDLAGSGIDALKDISIDIPLKKIMCGIDFEISQEKDCVKFSTGISEDGEEIELKGWDKADKTSLFQLEESDGINMNCSYGVGGYLAYGCTADQTPFLKEASLYLFVEIGVTFGATWMVVIPLRFEASFSGDAMFTIGLSKEYSDSYTDISCETTIGLDLSLRLGIGIAVASAGVYGKGRLETVIPSFVSTLSGEFGAYVKILWFKYDYTIFKGSLTFGGQRKQTRAEEMILHNSSGVSGPVMLEPIELHDTSEWTAAAVDDGISVPLQTALYNYVRPQMVSAGDTVMMVFERFNTEYSLENSQELVYSLYDKSSGTWSEPQPIEPDNRQFDNNFTLYSDGSDIYVAFTQANAEVTSSVDTAEESVLYQDVYVTKYDAVSNSFSAPERLTDNNSYDVISDISVIDGIPTAVWVRNENGEPFTLDNSNSIYMSRFENGVWSEETLMAAGLNSVTGLDIGTLGGKQYIAVATDSDNDFETPDDSKLFFIDTDKNIVASDIEGFSGGIEFTNINNSSTLLAYCSGKAVTITSPENAPEEFAKVPEMSSTADAKFLEYEEGMYAISYLSLNETGGCVRAVTYDGTEWHDAITLSESTDYVGAYALDYRDGQFIVVMREDDIVFTSDTEFDVDSTLGGIAFSPTEDMYINDAGIDSAGIIPGEEFNASVCIVNNAPVHSQYANVILRDAEGNIISSSSVEVNLDSGESGYFDVTLTAPSALTTEGYTITAEPLQKMRAMRFSAAPEIKTKQPKTFNISLVSPDLCVEAEQVMLGASQNVLVNVTNDGNEKATGGMLMIRKGDAFSSEEAFTQLEIGEMNPGETKSFLVEIPGEIYTEGEGIVTAYVESHKDLYSFNNKCTVAIMQMTQGEAIYSPDENTAPVLGTTYIETDLYKLSDKSVGITLNGTSFKSIDGLTSGRHYSFSGSTLTLKKAYLSTLTPGKHDITLNFTGEHKNFTKTLSIYVTDSSPMPIGGRISISGNAASGKTLSVDTSALTPSDAEYDITWYSGSTTVSTERTYKVKDSDIGKKIYVKLTAKGDFTGTVTSNSVTVEKTSSTTEFAPVEAAKTCNSITLIKTEGYEYRISTGDWTTDTVFNNLTADTEYTFYSRKAESDYAYAGEQSVATVIKTAAHTAGDAPTCTKPQTCTVCNAEINPGTGHPDTKTEPATVPTCTSVGYTEGIYCNDCEKYIEGHEEIGIDENAHIWINGTITTTATCKVNGVKTYTCQHNPDHKKTEDIGLNSTNHVDTKQTDAVSATCMSVGYTEGVYCNDCEKYISGHTEVGINSDNHINTKITEAVSPTCISIGYTEGVYCTDCEKYISGHTEVGINSDNHINTKITETVAPTCISIGYTEGVYCTDCEKYVSGHKKIVDSDAHKWDNGTITTVATCEIEGIKTFTCAYDNNHTYTENLGLNTENHVNTHNTRYVAPTCMSVGYTEGVYCNDCEKYVSGHKKIVDTNAHKWDNGEITTVSTCSVNGVKTYTCQHNPDHKKTEKLNLDSSNHINTRQTAAVAATCMRGGYTKGIFCDDCEKYIFGHTETGVDPSNHKWDSGTITAATQATCKKTGTRIYTCQYNSTHKKAVNYGIDSTNHVNTKNTEAVAPTCTAPGYSAGVFCNDCQKYASGHTEIIDTNAHKWNSGEITTVSTCNTNGIKTFTCEYDNNHTYTENLGLNTENHVNTKNTEAVAPTCSDVGYTTGVFCNDCEKFISGHNEIGIDTNAHKWNNGKITTAATCKVNGIKTFTCAYDKNHTYTENLGLNTENHVNTKNTEAVAPTCSDVGYTAGVYCNDCEKFISGHNEIGIDTSAHKWNSGEIITTATCKIEGLKIFTCEYDKNHTYTENLGPDTENHVNTKNTEAVAPTCTAPGYTAGVFCNDCQKYASGHAEIVDANAHKWNSGEITTTATCKVNGIKTFTCAYDKNHTYTENLGLNTENHLNTKNTEAVAPTCSDMGYTAGVYCNDCQKFISGHFEIGIATTAHKWNNGEITTAATCKINGIKTFTCAYDNNHTYTENLGLDTANHVHTNNVTATAPTCTTVGYTEGVYCYDCQKYISGHAEISAPGHDYKDTVTAPNCTNDGFTTHTCTRCKNTYTDTKVNALGHEYKSTVTAPNCTNTGFTTHTCTRCKNTYTDTKVNALGHKWGEWTEILAPTLTENGKEERICSVCKLKQTQETAKLTLDLGDVNGDSKITAADARLALRASVGLESFNEAEISSADIDGNGTVSAADARLILRASVGLENLDKYKK